MNTATSHISTAARHITRAAEQQIATRTGMRVTLVLCPSDNARKGPEQMLRTLANALNVSMECFRAKVRQRNIVELRFLAALLLRRYYPNITLKQIALLFGGQDHTSVMNALIRANDLLDIKDLVFTRKHNLAVNTIDQWLKEQ